jgi:dihydroorotate dehydrogenase electron transfer subunit
VKRATFAPFGRRVARVSERSIFGAYVVLRCHDRTGPAPRAGQFYMIAAAHRWGGGEGERPFLPRAFSVLRAVPHLDGGQELQFLIEDVGPGTKRLGELGIDDELALVGPLGIGFEHAGDGHRALLVGGGVGLAPLAIWQDELAAGELALLAKGAALLSDARVATDDGSVGYQGPVTDLLLEQLDADAHATVYACGPPAMLEAVRALCAARGVPAQLALESGMACGFGACFGCVVPTRRGYVRLCVDGPVLDAGELDTALVLGAGH